MIRLRSLRGRLLAAMLGVFVLGLTASLASYRFEVHNLVSDLHARTLQTQARALLAALHERPGGGVDVRLPADWQRVYRDPSRQFTYTLFDASHRPVARSDNLAVPLPDVPIAASAAMGPVGFIGVGADRETVLAARGPHGSRLVVARRGMSQDTLIDSLFAEQGEHLLVLLPFALLALGLIWVVIGWSLRPLARASAEAALVGPRRPGLRITTDGLPREIQPLVDAVNGALDRLARAYSAERRLTADAAHELRTPLATLSLRLQRARLSQVADWPAVERDLAQMSRLVDQLLDLTRKESLAHQRPLAELPLINLARVVREAAAMVVPLIEARGRRLQVDVPDKVPVHGLADDLRDLIRNLLDNALVHGRGRIQVRLLSQSEPSGAGVVLQLAVSDEGEGVPAGQESVVFERFCRLNSDSPGSGLGLAIVRQVARSHGGEVRFLAGRGCVVLSLPVPLAVHAPVPGEPRAGMEEPVLPHPPGDSRP